jgi:hypothetical protein
MKLNWFIYSIIILLVITNVFLISTIIIGMQYIIEDNYFITENINTINKEINTLYTIELGNYITETKINACERINLECKDITILQINEKTLSTKEYLSGYKMGWCVDIEYKSYISIVDGEQSQKKWVTQSGTQYIVLTSNIFELKWSQVGVADNQLCMARK